MSGLFVLLIMDKNIHAIFANMTELNPAEGLSGRIFACIEKEKDRTVRRKLIVSRFSLGVSAILFVASIFSFGQTILQSEFWNILTLAFSDMQVIAQNWQEFAFSLLETFPIVSMVAVLTPIMVLMFSFGTYLELEMNNRHKYIFNLYWG